MIKFGLLKIEGFRSIGNVDLNLDTGGITIIRGANGVGKTSILNALIWALYGKTIKGSTDVLMKKAWQPKDYSGVKVEIFYQKDGATHHIIRCNDYKKNINGSKGKNRVIYEIDGADCLTKGKSNIQSLIEESIGMSQRLFKNSVTFGQRLKRIAQETGPDKKALFEEAFDVGYLSLAKNIASRYKQKFQKEFDIFSEKVKAAEDQYQEVKNTYLELKENEDNFKKLQREELRELRAKVENLKSKLQSLKIGKTPNNIIIEKLQSRLDSIKTKRKENREKLSEYKSEEGLVSLIEKVLNFLNKNKTSKAISLLKDILEYVKDDDKLISEIDELNKKIGNAKEAISDYKYTLSEQKSMELKIEEYEDQAEKIRNKRNEVLSPKYKKRRLEIRKKLRVLRIQLNKNKKELDNYTWAINDPLSNSGIKTFLFDTSLGLLNKHLESYAKVIGLDIQFTVDTFSKKRDFITLIQRDEEDLIYEDMSGGEEQLVDVAMAFALHQTTTVSKGVNLLFLDELFENLDAENVDVINDLIRLVANGKSLFIITHKPNFNVGNSKTLEVVKENNISYIK